MPNELITVIYFLMWYALIALAILYMVFGLDDLFFDVCYWFQYAKQRFFGHQKEPFFHEKLIVKEEQSIAILIPCWHESQVIGKMLNHNYHAIDYERYHFFVGVYPNDHDTAAEVKEVARELKNVHCVIGHAPGPSSKAENLNTIYQHVKSFEQQLGQTFDIFVLHDSEDVIHPMSLKLYNYLIPNYDMIQLPVFPLATRFWNMTHWLYAEEFSENHTKDIVVRSALNGHIPSAGVGTAFSRSVLQHLEDPNTHVPFSVDSLTEDYRISLLIRVRRFKQLFVSRHLVRTQWQKRRFFRKGYRKKVIKEMVATRALFPMQYKNSVRQKARWIVGIAFQEWDHSKWPKGWGLRYTLAHDRKSLLTHFINGSSYAVFFFWLFYSKWAFTKPEFPALYEQFHLHPACWWLMWFVLIIMLERLAQRMIATRRIYGWRPLLLSIPRAFYGNVLNFHAVLRAYKLYYFAPKRNQTMPTQLHWDKTEHAFPEYESLTPYRRKLGELLVELGYISQAQLHEALIEQEKKGESLGEILCRFNRITPHQLTHVLSIQYNLQLFPKSNLALAQNQCKTKIKKKLYKWLLRQGISPVAVDESGKTLTLAIEDPTNQLLLKKAVGHVSPYQVKFVMIDVEA